MDEKLTQQQSLEIITEMINRTQNKMRKNGGVHMIFRGYLVAATALANILLMFPSEYRHQSFAVWWLMIPGTVVSVLMGRRKRREANVKTFTDSLIEPVWLRFAGVAFMLVAVVVVLSYRSGDRQVFAAMSPVIMILFGYAEYITAKICRFKAFLYGAYGFRTGAVVCIVVMLLPYENYYVCMAIQLGVYAACMILGAAVPGHRLNESAKKHV